MSNSSLIKYKDKKGNSYPHLYIDRLSNIFYLRANVDGTTRTASLETTDFNKARALVFDKMSEISKADYYKGKKKNKIILDFYETMMLNKTVGETNPETLKRIETIWRLSIRPFWEYLTPQDVNQDRVIEFMTWHRRNRPGVQFVNVFKYLGNIFNVMVESGDLPIGQKPKLELPKDEVKHHDKQKGRYITDAEARDLVQHSTGQVHLAISIAYCTGMRKMEILSLETSRLKKTNDRYIIKLDTDDTKTGLAREIPLPSYLGPQIDTSMALAGLYLFPMKSDQKRHVSSQVLDKEWSEVKDRAGIRGRLRFHDLRHTAASNFAKSNINPFIAVTILGMSFATFQKKYLKLKVEDLIIGTETNADRLRK